MVVAMEILGGNFLATSHRLLTPIGFLPFAVAPCSVRNGGEDIGVHGGDIGEGKTILPYPQLPAT